MTDDAHLEPKVGPLRRSINIPPKTLEQLDEIKQGIDASSHAEVIRIALNLYKELLDARQRGARVIIEEPNGSQRTVSFLNLPVSKGGLGA